MVKAKKKPDLTEGPIFSKMLLFTLPIMATALLQVFYNMADNIVVGSFSGDDLALAAVGSTSSLTSVVVSLLMGLATGAGVAVAQAYGAKDNERVSRSVHTAVTFSFILGIAFSTLAFILAEPLLTLLGTKSELYESALLYYRIICIGLPASTIYNFASAILRSCGDSRSPLYILSCSGLINVILNIFFVIVCKMTVDGVAIATVVSQYLAAAVFIIILLKNQSEPYALSMKKLGIDRSALARIIRLGLPAGLQSSLFGLTNAMLTGAVNTLPTTSISAKTIAFNIDGISYTAMNSFLHSTMAFVGQNYGAKKLDRIKKTTVCAIVQVTMFGIVMGALLLTFSDMIIGMYLDPMNPDYAVIVETTKALMTEILSIYFLCGIMDTLSGILRGLGNSMAPMVISIVGNVVIRAIWIYVFFPMEIFNDLCGLYYCYPITWIIVDISMLLVLMHTWKKIKAELGDSTEKEKAALNA